VGIDLACDARRVMTKPRLTALTIVSMSAIYFLVLRPWHMNWGASEDEARRPVAGDELMPDAGIVSTRVVQIEAPPAAVWPWLVQMGPGRGSHARQSSTYTDVWSCPHSKSGL
jgi:hypothetical protein